MTDFKPLVLKSTYTKLKLTEIVPFVENVLNYTIGNKTYQELQDAMLEIRNNLEVFKLALIAAEDAGNAAKQKKESSYDTLILSLNYVSSGIEFFAKGNVEYITGTGMSAQSAKKAKSKAAPTTMLPPQITKIEASKIPGHVDLEYTEIVGTKVYGFEYSEDQITWKNGQYSHKTFGSIAIPTRKDIWVKVRAIGVHKIQSEFSTAAQIFIA
jgi:hypothetical protein